MSYKELCDLMADAMETYAPKLSSEKEVLERFHSKLLSTYEATMEMAANSAKTLLLANPDSTPFGCLVPQDCEHIAELRAYLKTVNDGADFRAALMPGSKRLMVGPAGMGASVKPVSPAPSTSTAGSHAYLITMDKNFVYRGNQRYSLNKLKQVFPGLCYGALLSVRGEPSNLCRVPHQPGHQTPGQGAHALPPDFREKVQKQCLAPKAEAGRGRGAEAIAGGTEEEPPESGAVVPDSSYQPQKGKGRGKGRGGGRSRGRGKRKLFQ